VLEPHRSRRLAARAARAEDAGGALDTQMLAGGLSAGEAQLLAFARVFLRDPGLVILDEASSRLDPATERHIERAIDALFADRTASSSRIAWRPFSAATASSSSRRAASRSRGRGPRSRRIRHRASRSSSGPASSRCWHELAVLWHGARHGPLPLAHGDVPPWIYLTDNVLWTAVYCARLAAGSRGAAGLRRAAERHGGPTTIAWISAAFVGSGIAGAVAETAGMSIDVFFRFSVSAVLQRNMLAEILHGPVRARSTAHPARR